MRYAGGGGPNVFSLVLVAPTPTALKTPAVRGGFNRLREYQRIGLAATFVDEVHRLDLGAVTGGSYKLGYTTRPEVGTCHTTLGRRH
jgi:hypothetical protein